MESLDVMVRNMDVIVNAMEMYWKLLSNRE